MTDTDEIFGLETSADDAARLMLQFINNDWIEVEPALYTGKWFDYRFMNPVQATYLYAHHYVKAYKAAFSRNIDTAKSEHVRPLRDEDLFKCKRQQISGIWRGRQVADAMGMPYDVYLRQAFEWTLRYWQQRHLPRPQQLYSDLATDRAAIAWIELQPHKLYFSDLPQYKNEAYATICEQMEQGDFAGKVLISQNAHHEWLFEQAALRGNNPDVLARMIYQSRVLPADKVQGRLGAETFEQVLEAAASMPNN